MKQSELKTIFGSKVFEETCHNPLDIAESVEFARSNKDTDYRERAINKVTDLKLPFSSTCNSVFDIFKRFVTV